MFVQLLFFLTLMLTLEAEWVEIPQQHYVKPGRSPDTPGHAATKQETLQTSTPRNKNTNPASKHRATTTTERIHETSAKRVSSNTSANPHRVKANVLKVPATIARVEHVKKPAKDNKHSTASKSVVAKSHSDEESPSSFLTNKKNTFHSKEHDSELGLEIYKLTLPKEKTETTTRSAVARKPLVNKGSNRIYLYSTPDPNEHIKATTEKVKIAAQTTDKASKPNKVRGGHHNTEKRNNIKSINETLKSVNSIEDISAGSRTPSGINPFLNKNSNRRIYIHGSSEENIHSMTAKTRPPTEKSNHNIGVKVSSKGSNPKNRTRGNPRTTTESPGHYTTVKNVRPHVPNRIYINQIVKSQDVKHSSTTNVPAVFRPHREKHKSTTESTEVHSIKESNISTKYLSTEQSDESDKSQSEEVKTNPQVIKKNDFKIKNVKRVEKLPTNRHKDDIKVVSVESVDSGIMDQIPLDAPIRRIDISSITSPDDPEFITKQEFVDEDDAKHMFKDYEEVEPTPDIDRVLSGSSSAQDDEVSVEHYEDVIVDPPKLDNFYDTYEQHTETNKDDPENIPKPITNPKDNIANNDKHTVPSDEKQPRPIENVIKFMKVVSDTISKNTHRSIKSKMRYLEDLRDTLLMNIEHRIDSAWPDGAAAEGARGRRSARGHVEFPSSEGALMSISFLTFAVFLIKLVLQVIHTYKNKAMMMTPAVVAISRAAAAFRNP
ncbi:hypothetical protein JYU34_018428 [Plutella xylostella]|uniref:Uncharacterized protein n=1 Tax=Plutella xylostella TaxID=51655 RepID=A0ABQ7PXK6_PLUXY|nr:hypothetical protein JYU34_018428 [Plutella xylostella]